MGGGRLLPGSVSMIIPSPRSGSGSAQEIVKFLIQVSGSLGSPVPGSGAMQATVKLRIHSRGSPRLPVPVPLLSAKIDGPPLIIDAAGDLIDESLGATGVVRETGVRLAISANAGAAVVSIAVTPVGAAGAGGAGLGPEGGRAGRAWW